MQGRATLYCTPRLSCDARYIILQSILKGVCLSFCFLSVAFYNKLRLIGKVYAITSSIAKVSSRSDKSDKSKECYTYTYLQVARIGLRPVPLFHCNEGMLRMLTKAPFASDQYENHIYLLIYSPCLPLLFFTGLCRACVVPKQKAQL